MHHQSNERTISNESHRANGFFRAWDGIGTFLVWTCDVAIQIKLKSHRLWRPDTYGKSSIPCYFLFYTQFRPFFQKTEIPPTRAQDLRRNPRCGTSCWLLGFHGAFHYPELCFFVDQNSICFLTLHSALSFLSYHIFFCG